MTKDGRDESDAAGSSRRPEADRSDPFAAVLNFGSRAVRNGLIVGFSLATLSHGAFGGRALAAPVEMLLWATRARQTVHTFLWSEYDIDLIKRPAPEKKLEKPKEEPEDEDEALNKPLPKAAEAASPPPPAAQAGKILTAPSDPDEPVDLTGNGFVTGDADAYVGGVTAPAGTGTTPTYNPAASPTGKPGGKGTGTGPIAPPPKRTNAPDRSRSASITAGSSWSSCPFPPQADVDQVDYAVVTLVVTVRPDGSPRSVRVLNDPGHGFGRSARMCALSQRYRPALGRDGKPLTGTTPPIRVTFTR